MAATTWQVPRCSAMLRHFQCEQDIDLEELAVARYACFVWEAGSDLCGRLAVMCMGGWQ